MRVLVSAFGTTGDLHPMVAIAAAMRRRGHDVHLLANPAYQSLAEEVDVHFQPVGTLEDLESIKQDPRAWNYGQGWKLWLRGAGVGSMRALYQRIQELYQPGETIVAAHYLSFGARVAQDRLAIPTATVHLNVHTIRSVYHVYAYPPPSFVPDWLPRSYLMPQWSSPSYRHGALWLAERFFIEPVLAREIHQFRSELDLDPLDTFVRKWWDSPDMVIGLFPDWWSGYHPDWPAHVVTTNFPFWDRANTIATDDELESFLERADGTLVFTPGASANHTERHFRAFAGCCDRLQRTGIVITPKPAPAGIDPTKVHFASYVPFSRLFQSASAVVHHAGIGTSAHCLAAGLPQIVAPTLYNEPDTAIRLERLGVAKQVSTRRFSASKLSSAVESLLNSSTVAENCHKYSQLARATDAIDEVCPRLESLLDSKRRSRVRRR